MTESSSSQHILDRMMERFLQALQPMQAALISIASSNSQNPSRNRSSSNPTHTTPETTHQVQKLQLEFPQFGGDPFLSYLKNYEENCLASGRPLEATELHEIQVLFGEWIGNRFWYSEQTSTVLNYYKEFSDWKRWMDCYQGEEDSQDFLAQIFIKGLKEEVGSRIPSPWPQTLVEALNVSISIEKELILLKQLNTCYEERHATEVFVEIPNVQSKGNCMVSDDRAQVVAESEEDGVFTVVPQLILKIIDEDSKRLIGIDAFKLPSKGISDVYAKVTALGVFDERRRHIDATRVTATKVRSAMFCANSLKFDPEGCDYTRKGTELDMEILRLISRSSDVDCSFKLHYNASAWYDLILVCNTFAHQCLQIGHFIEQEIIRAHIIEVKYAGFCMGFRFGWFGINEVAAVSHRVPIFAKVNEIWFNSMFKCLGPKGMDKILQSTGRGHSVTVTNDGATILKSLHMDNAAAKVLVDISKVQDDEVGDGTTSVVVLAGELLREAEKLVATKIHPMRIIAGYRMAAECARNSLLAKVVDNKADAEKFKSDLMKIDMTTLSSKILPPDKEHFTKLAVDAVMRFKASTNLESIQIIKKAGGSLIDSFLNEGFILYKKIGVGQPKQIENAKILVAHTAIDTDEVKIYGACVRVDSMARVAPIEGAEKDKMKEKVQKLISHGINCFVNRQLIYNVPEELFVDAGILAIEHADFDDIERLALVTGGEIASIFANPKSVRLGHCKLIEEIIIGEDKLIHFSGVEMGQACTIVLRGASFHVLDEAKRSLHDAMCVLSQTVSDSRVLLGNGWREMVMAKAVDELARQIPGLDSAELNAQLHAEHHKEGSNAGIDIIFGSAGDMAAVVVDAMIAAAARSERAAFAGDLQSISWLSMDFEGTCESLLNYEQLQNVVHHEDMVCLGG